MDPKLAVYTAFTIMYGCLALISNSSNMFTGITHSSSRIHLH